MTESPTSRPARESSPTPTRTPSTRSACASSPRWKPRLRWPRANDDPADRQLRQLHLQPRPPLPRVRRRGGGAAERRDHGRRGGAPRSLPPRRLPRPRPPGGLGCDRRDRPPARADDPDARGLPRPPGDRRGVRRRERPGAPARAREGECGRARRPGDLRGPAAAAPGGALPLARRDARAGGARGVGDDRGRRGDGGPAPVVAGGRRPVSPRVRADARRAAALPELPGATLIQRALERLLDGHHLARDEAREAMGAIMAGEATPAQIGGFLVALRLKGETPDEIAGFAEAIRGHVLDVTPRRDDLVDTAGTGGDGQATINISTAAALVAAAGGAAVAKHVNRAVSSASGSADVLDAFGFRVAPTTEKIERSIDELGFGF